MENKILFGDLLGELLTLRGWTASKLSIEINVDASYVRKWVRGERTPSLKSNYIEKISNCILKGLDTKAYENYIEDLGYEIQADILDIMREAQINSLTANKKYHTAMKKENKLSKIPPFVKGKEEVFKYATIIFNAAIKNRKPNRNIFITFQGEKDILDGYEKTHQYFLDIVSKVLRVGWKIEHLWRLKSNDTRIATLVRNIVEFSEVKKRYEPRYFIKYGTITPPLEFIVFEDLAAILFVSDETNDYISSAFFYTNEDEIDTLKKHVELMSLQTMPIINYNYDRSLKDIINKDGDVFSLDMDGRLILHKKNVEEALNKYKIKEIIVPRDINNDETLICFKNMLRLLENCPNYELAVVDKVPSIKNIPKFMILKENVKLLMNMGEQEFSIEEPITIGGFKDFFTNLWDEIPPINRSREYTMEWLKKRII
ncbi:MULTISPECIES: helix-turn-helix domain-containing protein [Clostridium]|uniref:helix-turn-helix domain-containing protein n=1 Tax=Clostridium TaxID=1485 RepID=UPI000824DEBC|nr:MULTISPECIES: helix-turn-helix transcriptional regulator [Clostridium]PJI08543.1 XRE family transcriptional regulator [Clostridium sp. CT7]